MALAIPGQTPRVGKPVQGFTLNYSDGVTPFSGYWLVELVPPTQSGTDWLQVNIGTFPGIRLPQFMKMPIILGVFNNAIGLFYNQDLTPPGSQYRAWLYDLTDRQLSGPGAYFSISTPTFTPVITTPTLPTALQASPVNPDA